jgi:hypothetical protein
MRVLITSANFMLGGTETYSVTVAEQLERLGHPTRLHAGNATAQGRELAASRGLQLTVGDDAAPDRVDVVLAQDAASAYALASRRSDLRQVFVVHGLMRYEHPPAGLRPSLPVVVLNDRIGARAAALSPRPEIVRLRQPIDIERFRPRRPSRSRARRVLALGNYLDADRVRMLEEACGDLGLELAHVGIRSTPNAAPQEAIADADIVVGYGRAVLEAMAMGRAAYVWDRGGGDGWVTPESYPAFEADGFSGAATDAVIDAGRLRADFAAYRPELGPIGYDLVRSHHSAAKHAEALVRLLEAGGPPDPELTPTSETALEALALLVRAEARASNRAGQLEAECRLKAEELQAVREGAAAEHELAVAEREKRLAAEREAEAVIGSRTWRLTAPLRRAAVRRRG